MLLTSLFAVAVATATPDLDRASLLAAERGFAADAQRDGVRRAFLAHFDAGSWLFRPLPLPALDTLARDADDSSFLQWEPDLVGISEAGDVGFTSGPWSAHGAGSEKISHGHFLTVWRRAEDGIWRVQADNGVAHAGLAKAAAVVTLAAPTASSARADIAAIEDRRRQLERVDDELRRALAGDHAKSALPAFAGPTLHVLRQSQLPADAADALNLVAKDPAGLGRGPRRALGVAASGDLGYTLGGAEACAGCGSDLRIWQWRDNRWKVLVDLSTMQP
ncbi:hypothetical protein [Dokdonella soli]|uniref:Nuclear transport factor 2 family protein n=1 Tax=Dokdonella soli TaxID=529810 RepID=A0ABN1IMJ7_9GAMM